ncbi:MAG: hypothetical protein HOK65_06825 [Crocinitomicaceae bacterium]|nr:hypothetical protein [Crocinitomicaceae bacterium]
MKLFIIKIIFAGVIPLSLVFTISYLWSTNIIEKGSYFSIPNEIHSVILGHSHSACAFNDSIIDGFYNLSQNTEGYPYTYFKAQKIIEDNKHVKNIFIEYTNNQITPWASNRIYGIYLDINVPRIFPVADKKFILKSFYKSGNISEITNAIIKSYKSNLEFIISGKRNYLEEFWHNNITPQHVFSADTSHMPLDFYFKSSEINFGKNFIDIYSVHRENLIYLFKMKALCKKHKVNLFLIRSPLPQHVSFSNESTFINIKETFFSDIAFLDFKDYPMNLCFFADNQHLNRKGGIEFSHFFNDSIVPNGLIDKSSLLKKAK